MAEEEEAMEAEVATEVEEATAVRATVVEVEVSLVIDRAWLAAAALRSMKLVLYLL